MVEKQQDLGLDLGISGWTCPNCGTRLRDWPATTDWNEHCDPAPPKLDWQTKERVAALLDSEKEQT